MKTNLFKVPPVLGLLVLSLLAPAPAAAQTATAAAPPETTVNGLGLEFVLIPAGSDVRSWTAPGPGGEEIAKKLEIVVSRPFYLGKYEVTQEQWQAVMGKNPSRHKSPQNPVESVSWLDVQEFIQKLNEKSGHKYRLPTAAEWEHAARAGSRAAYFWGDDPAALSDYAWHRGNSNSPNWVGGRKPNPWGLYDIYGNVAEWTADWDDNLEDYLLETDALVLKDPAGPESGDYRVILGCGWFLEAERPCWGGTRERSLPGNKDSLRGFRLAFSPAP